jgi:hypothetical protein
MTQQNGFETGSVWKPFLRKHWGALAVFVIAAALAVVAAVYVFVWFVGNAQSSGLVPSGLGLWTMNHVVMFILHAIFWELVLIGIPAVIGAILAWQWWKRLPDEEKKEYMFGKSSRTRDAGGAISPLFFIAFAIKVYIDGNWNAAISTFTLDYVVGSMVVILIWAAVIIGVPLAIGGIWWISHEMKTP